MQIYDEISEFIMQPSDCLLGNCSLWNILEAILVSGKNVNMCCFNDVFNFLVLSSWTVGKCLPRTVKLDCPLLKGQNLKKRQECKSKLIAWNNLKNPCVAAANDAFDDTI